MMRGVYDCVLQVITSQNCILYCRHCAHCDPKEHEEKVLSHWDTFVLGSGTGPVSFMQISQMASILVVLH